MKNIEAARKKAAAGERLSLEDALALYEDNDLLFLADCARRAKEKKSGRSVYYTVNRHINLTNICSSNCPLCAFQVEAGDARGFVMEPGDIERVLEQAKKTPNLSEIHIVSALHPDKPFSYYRAVVRQVKAALPEVDVKAFTPVEIVNFAKMTGKSIREVLSLLKEDGLDTIEERLQHLITIREIQDETGGFQAFMLFPFHPAHTKLGEEYHLQRVGSWEDMKMMALSRLILDNIDHVKAFWIMLTMPVAQLALGFGADDLDGTIGEEKIIHAAGARTKTGITRTQLEKIIREAGYEPVERDTFYRPIGGSEEGV